MKADITDRARAEAAVQQAVRRFGRLDALVNNAGLMLLGPVAGADPGEWDRMIAVNVQGLLYTTRTALPHLLQAAEEGSRRVADIVNVSSIAGRVAWNGYGVYSFTKFGINGFTESLRQEVTQRHLRVGLVEPGGVATELGSHNKPEIRRCGFRAWSSWLTDVRSPRGASVHGGVANCPCGTSAVLPTAGLFGQPVGVGVPGR